MSDFEDILGDPASVNSPGVSDKSDDDSLGSVSASASDLVKHDSKSLRFGKSLATHDELQPFYVQKALNKDLVRLPEDESIPKPGPDECVVYRDFFTTGLCFPTQD